MTEGPLLVIAAGGTGGHMFPAQALAEEMLKRGWRVRLSTDPRGARYTGGFPHSVEIEEASSGTFARGGLVAKLQVPFQILAGTMKTISGMRKDPPAAVVGFGGYPAIPAMLAAWVLRLPRMIHEQNGVLGRVNQLLAKRVNLVACGTWPTELPNGVTGVFTGNPVRRQIRDVAGAEYQEPSPDNISILAIGGSQGARILSDVMPEAISLLSPAVRQNLRIAQQARPEDISRCVAAYDEAGVFAEVEPFFRDVPRRLTSAQLVISRSGASSVADIAVVGRPSVLIPLASAIRDEQTANARGLTNADAAVLMPESRLNPESLATVMAAILENPAAARQMADAALKCGRPDAASDLANLVEDLAIEKIKGSRS